LDSSTIDLSTNNSISACEIQTKAIETLGTKGQMSTKFAVTTPTNKFDDTKTSYLCMWQIIWVKGYLCQQFFTAHCTDQAC